jgi:hypothetical protein
MEPTGNWSWRRFFRSLHMVSANWGIKKLHVDVNQKNQNGEEENTQATEKIVFQFIATKQLQIRVR